MSLKDRLRGLRGGDGKNSEYDAAPGGSPSGAGLSGTVELTEFAPRQDGDYHCIGRGLYLRFARPVVTETDIEHADAARGEFTTSGRFTVQRAFGRPIVYTILGETVPGGGNPGNDAALVVRRTDTETRAAERLEFIFEPDEV